MEALQEAVGDECGGPSEDRGEATRYYWAEVLSSTRGIRPYPHMLICHTFRTRVHVYYRNKQQNSIILNPVGLI